MSLDKLVNNGYEELLPHMCAVDAKEKKWW